MLKIVHAAEGNERAQASLEAALKSTLADHGSRNIGFPGGNVDHTVFASGARALWAAFGGLVGADTPRYWNAFGVFRPDRPSQMISVEINIPTDGNRARVAGFFAEDSDTSDIYLMHSGRVGGGRRGIGKSAFLVWSKAKLVEVSAPEGGVRSGIAVARLGDADLVERIWKFVRTVQDFKDKAAAGELDSPDFKRRVTEDEDRDGIRAAQQIVGKRRCPSSNDLEQAA